MMDDLVALVAERGLLPGDRLPPEVELARMRGVGRSESTSTPTPTASWSASCGPRGWR